MKFQVTQKGVYDAKGEMIEIGRVIEVKGDAMPAYLVGKAVDVTDAKAITNPAKGAVQQSVAKADA